MNHDKHEKVRLYRRETQKWVSTNYYDCECGAVLEKNMKKKEVEKE